MTNNSLKQLTKIKQRFDKYKPLPSGLIKNLDDWFKVELTYTSNAIEGNTLSRKETALVIEKGLTVRGKSIIEHLEAINHSQALTFIKKLAHKKRQDITENNILEIHRLILQKIDDTHAGRYRTVAVRIAGVTGLTLPNPTKIPRLMKQFVKWLHQKNTCHPAKIASDAHLKLVSIHPFVDGNGRTARLLMNLLLIQNNYPPALIRKEDRKNYIDSLEKAQTKNNPDDYYHFIYQAIIRSLNIYIETLSPPQQPAKSLPTVEDAPPGLLRIGELSQKTGEQITTIRYWTKEDLLTVKDYTKGGYQLYDHSMIARIKKIRQLQNKKRLKITEIKNYFNPS